MTKDQELKASIKIGEITQQMIDLMEEDVSVHMYWQAIAHFLIATHVADHVKGKDSKEAKKTFSMYLKYLKEFRSISVKVLEGDYDEKD